MSDLDNTSVGAFWLNDFNGENIIDYALAARSMLQYFRVLFKEGFDSIVVPSRGSWPLVNAAKSAWYIEQRYIRSHAKTFEARLEIMMSPLTQKTILPFSADPQTNAQTTAEIRRYWAHVLNAIVKREGRTPHLVTYKTVIENLTKQSIESVLPRDLPSEKFIFVDTVVSGRAICEIVSAFNEVGLNQCYFLLIVDEEGRNIEGKYERVIQALESENRCTRIPVKRLFTEDRGPAVSGIWSTVYPQFLHEIQQNFPWANSAYGAGSFYHKVSSSQELPIKGLGNPEYNMPVTRLHASLSTALHHVMSEFQRIEAFPKDALITTGAEVDSVVYKRVKQEIEDKMRNQLAFQLNCSREFVNELGSLSPLEQETTRILAEPRVRLIEPSACVSISGSHLVRVTFPDKVVRDQMKNIHLALQGGESVFANSWFRNA